MDSPLLFLSVLFFSFSLSFSQKPNGLVFPVTKDSSTLQYVTRVNQRTPPVPVNLVVDLGGEHLWVDCDNGYVSSTYRPVQCGSNVCSAANSFGCRQDCFPSPAPGCNNNTCLIFTDNQFTRTSSQGELATDVISMRATDGSKSGPAVTDPHFLFSCGATSLLEGLAHGSTGIIGLGHNKVSAPEQLAANFRFQRTFAICLSSSKGYMFFGGGPYMFLPNNNVSNYLTYTPLRVNPVSTAGVSIAGQKSADYFIGVRSIKINEKPVKLNQTLLKINKDGTGGTKISTVHPYTLLERSIYKAVLGAFATALNKAKQVTPVAPFGLCFDQKSVGSTWSGPLVPSVDLVLQGNSIWHIVGTNSMVAVNSNVLCLGFVDAGVNPTTSIVIGGHQLEDNFLVFDLARSRLGFSSSLLFRQTSCANFNYAP